MIIRNVPYVEDKKEEFATCQGPPTVMMAFEYFLPNEQITFKELYKRTGYARGKWFFETYIARFFHQLKIPVKYYSTEDLFAIGDNPSRFTKVCGLDFNNQKHRDELDLENYDSAVEYVTRNQIFEKRDINIRFIREKLSEEKLVIATVNRNILTGKNGYKGHFILIKGFDDKGFICNDALLGQDLHIDFLLFEKAFFSFEKDEKGNDVKIADIVVIG